MSEISIHKLVVEQSYKVLIDNLSFVVPKSTALFILGHNGSGKSTFLKAITGRHPFKGTIALKGKPIDYRRNNKNIVSCIAVLDQHNDVSFAIRVLDLVVMGRYGHQNWLIPYQKSDYEAARQALADTGLSNFADRRFFYPFWW